MALHIQSAYFYTYVTLANTLGPLALGLLEPLAWAGHHLQRSGHCILWN